MIVMYSKEELINLAKKEKIVYRVTNLVNGKVYIGQTIRTFNKRYGGAGVGAERMKGYYDIPTNGKNTHLHNALIKYGTDNFKVDILCQCETIEELNKQEEFYIEVYNSTDYGNGYNKQSGGDNKRRGVVWRLERLLHRDTDRLFFADLLKKKYIDKDTMFNLLNTPVVYIKKTGNKKYYKYYYYPNIRICCVENKLNVEDGFCMAMRKRDNSRENKEKFHHVSITKHEIWFRDDIEIDRRDYENYKNCKLGRKKKETTPKTKKRKRVKHYKNCPCCGKTILSNIKLCADCKRERDKTRKK